MILHIIDIKKQNRIIPNKNVFFLKIIMKITSDIFNWKYERRNNMFLIVNFAMK